MHFVGSYDDARTRLPDPAPHGWIKIHEPNPPAYHQVKSVSAALANSPITSASSLVSAIYFAAFAQPARAKLSGPRITRSVSGIDSAGPGRLKPFQQ